MDFKQTDLGAHYERMYTQAWESFTHDSYEIDETIHDPNDTRYGITLVIRPSAAVKEKIDFMLAELAQVEPNQYYYPPSDIHITLMSIISCYPEFQLESIQVEEYVSLIKKSLATCKPFDIHFQGVTASPSCIMVQGFLPDDQLNPLRDSLRKHFAESTLENSLDKRYAIKTAHTTVLRLQKRLTNKTPFLETVQRFREHDFGSFPVTEIELVANDWYQRESRVKHLHSFDLTRNNSSE
ncbi:2'-5' RNA ligase family protein [Sphingobacterium bambusae]|uniref:2'-5' RNA ligase family protein n=1 Tax=Sphingobacterium bambusae TaxID=662858 RepID=A0ABW6BLK1_9SPHI|nr:2'-5' RNA ligase family protein [Sphingobacterium bambusae]WPL49914.1 mutarotase [Sphingobacterium bambusae]